MIEQDDGLSQGLPDWKEAERMVQAMLAKERKILEHKTLTDKDYGNKFPEIRRYLAGRKRALKKLSVKHDGGK